MRRTARLPRFPLLPFRPLRFSLLPVKIEPALIILWAIALPFAPRVSAQNVPVQSVSILKPKVYPGSPENRESIGRVIQWSVTRGNDLYGQHIAMDYDQAGERADYSVLVSASLSGDDSVINAQMIRNRDGRQAEAVPVLGRITAQSAIALANTIFYQWSSFHEYLRGSLEAAPQYVEEIPLDSISQTLFGTAGMLAPWSAAVKSDSRILIGTSTVCLEMDRSFRVIDQPGRELYDNGELGYANVVAVTPAGTTFFKNLSSGKVIKWFGGGLQPQSWKIGNEYMGSFVALPDGSALAAHAGQQQTLRLADRRPAKVEFLSQPNLYYSALASGPEGNIWIYSVAERRVRIYTTEGQLVDSVIPLDPDKPVPTQMTVYPDGSFLFFAQGRLYRFRRNGVPVWRTNELLDRAYCDRFGIRNTNEEQLIRANQRLSRNPDDVAALKAKADLYERIGTMEMARCMWEKILEIDPACPEAQSKLADLELARLLARAADLDRQTRSILETLGPESARIPYSQTMQLYEQILNLNPGNLTIQENRRELKLLFDESQRRITITAARIEDLFPSLMQRYRLRPVGTVSVHNTLDEEVRELSTSVFIEGYMDFPSESPPLPKLGAKQRAEPDLKVLFNTSVFDLQEDLPVQARIEVKYMTSRGRENTSRVEALMLYRKTALVRDDSAKLASFIMPNQEIVSTFAHKVSDIGEAGERYRLSDLLLRGMRVCGALGSYGIAYIEDPHSPISRVLGKEAVVDTVRFPRTTLLIRSGDCDDTTALLGSLLESVGIGTAIMTTPGHVFLAFDTGEPKENLWLFTHRNFQALVHGETVWLPVETTLLDDGFFAAWESASQLVSKHRGKTEFLPVREQRDRYPPLPLPATDLGVFEPSEHDVSAVFSRSLDSLEETLYGESLELLEERLEGQRGMAAARVRNQIGVLHARFGRDREAEAALSLCLAEEPDFTAAYLNLANLKLVRGELEEAAGVARTGLERKPGSALLNVLLALYHNRKGEAGKASVYLDKVRSSSPELAQRYSYLAESSSARARAGAEDRPSLIWDSGE